MKQSIDTVMICVEKGEIIILLNDNVHLQCHFDSLAIVDAINKRMTLYGRWQAQNHKVKAK